MEIKDVVNTSIAVLKGDSRFSDIDMSESSAFYNTFILPFSVLVKSVFDVNEYTRQLTTFSNPSELTEEQLNNLAKLVFAPARRTNSLCSVEVKVYLNYKAGTIEPLVISESDTFYSGQDSFKPIKEYLFVYELLPVETINSVQYRVASIIVKSETTNSKVAINTITSGSVLHPELAFIKNDAASTNPVLAETNEEYFQTIQNSLSERNLTSIESIATFLKDAYPTITDIFVTGYGDPEMQRDIAVAGRNWSGHFGGKSDVYVKSPFTNVTYTCTATKLPTNDGYYFIFKRYKGFDWLSQDTSNPNPNALLPWTEISLSDLPGASALPITPLIEINWDATTIGSLNKTKFVVKDNGEYDYIIEILPDSYGKNYRYSPYEQLKISIKTTQLDGTSPTINFNYKTQMDLVSIQNSLAATQSRNICNDILAKAFIPVRVQELKIVYDQNYSVDTSSWQAILAERINNWNTNTPIRFNDLLKDFPAPVRLSEVWQDGPTDLDFPYILDANGLVSSKRQSYDWNNPTHPCYAKMVMDNIDGTTSCYVSTRQINPLTSLGLSATYRTCRYNVDLSDIQIIPRSW